MNSPEEIHLGQRIEIATGFFAVATSRERDPEWPSLCELLRKHAGVLQNFATFSLTDKPDATTTIRAIAEKVWGRYQLEVNGATISARFLNPQETEGSDRTRGTGGCYYLYHVNDDATPPELRNPPARDLDLHVIAPPTTGKTLVRTGHIHDAGGRMETLGSLICILAESEGLTVLPGIKSPVMDRLLAALADFNLCKGIVATTGVLTTFGAESILTADRAWTALNLSWPDRIAPYYLCLGVADAARKHSIRPLGTDLWFTAENPVGRLGDRHTKGPYFFAATRRPGLDLTVAFSGAFLLPFVSPTNALPVESKLERRAAEVLAAVVMSTGDKRARLQKWLFNRGLLYAGEGLPDRLDFTLWFGEDARLDVEVMGESRPGYFDRKCGLLRRAASHHTLLVIDLIGVSGKELEERLEGLRRAARRWFARVARGERVQEGIIEIIPSDSPFTAAR